MPCLLEANQPNHPRLALVAVSAPVNEHGTQFCASHLCGPRICSKDDAVLEDNAANGGSCLHTTRNLQPSPLQHCITCHVIEHKPSLLRCSLIHLVSTTLTIFTSGSFQEVKILFKASRVLLNFKFQTIIVLFNGAIVVHDTLFKNGWDALHAAVQPVAVILQNC